MIPSNPKKRPRKLQAVLWQRRPLWVALLLMMLMSPVAQAGTGALGEMKQSAHADEARAVSGGAEAYGPATQAHRGRDPHTAALVFGFFFHLPHYYIERDTKYRTDSQFLGYPYEGGAKGYMTPLPLFRKEETVHRQTEEGDLLIGSGDDQTIPSYRTRSFALRLETDYCYGLESIHKTSGFMMLETRWRLGLEGGYSYFRESSKSGGWDTTGMGDLNAVYRFAQNRRVQMRTGFGGRFMVDGLGWSGGVNFTYGFDIYPVYPLVLSASVDFGNLKSSFVLHARGHLGAVFRSFEFLFGWDVLQVASITIHGPLAGVRVWI